jgi:hypothetical protein
VAAFDAAQSETWFESAFLEKAVALANQVALHWRETTDVSVMAKVAK